MQGAIFFSVAPARMTAVRRAKLPFVTPHRKGAAWLAIIPNGCAASNLERVFAVSHTTPRRVYKVSLIKGRPLSCHLPLRRLAHLSSVAFRRLKMLTRVAQVVSKTISNILC
jgi:hypothetical protein